MLRMTYYFGGQERELARQRIATLQRVIEGRWVKHGQHYKLPIEIRIVYKTNEVAPELNLRKTRSRQRLSSVTATVRLDMSPIVAISPGCCAGATRSAQALYLTKIIYLLNFDPPRIKQKGYLPPNAK